MLTVLVSTISNSQVFLLEKMWVAFANAKATHIFFSKNISIYAIFNDQSLNDTLTNDIVSFEQLGPGRVWIATQFNIGLHWYYRIYPKNWDTLSLHHTYPKILTSPFYYLLKIMSKNCWMNGKQCWPWSDAASATSDLGLHYLLRLSVRVLMVDTVNMFSDVEVSSPLVSSLWWIWKYYFVLRVSAKSTEWTTSGHEQSKRPSILHTSMNAK